MYCVKKYPVITAVVSICLYVGTLLYSGTFFALPKDLLITTRLPELLFGMYFMRYIKKVPATVGICAIAFLALQQFTSFLTDDVAVTLVGIAMFLLLVWVADFFDRQPVRVVIASISKYSYAIFLVHHQVISQVFSAVFPYQQIRAVPVVLRGLFNHRVVVCAAREIEHCDDELLQKDVCT
jgi:peptidoglycan/LPS O-acetylase OafA/YrhL